MKLELTNQVKVTDDNKLRYFMRKTAATLLTGDDDILSRLQAQFDVFVFTNKYIISTPLTIGDEELVEIEWKVKNEKT